MSGKSWSQEEIDLVKAIYSETRDIKKVIEQLPNRTKVSIYKVLDRTGFSLRKTWTTEDEKTLTDNYSTKTASQLSILIPAWDEGAIRRKAMALGLNKTAEYRSEAQKGENNHYYGHEHSQEVKERLKEVWDDRKKDGNWVHVWQGKNHTDDTKNKISDIRQDWFESNEHPFKGKEHSEESRLKMSHPKTWTEEGKQKIRDSVMSRPHGGYGNWTDYTRRDGTVVKLQSSYEVKLAMALDKWKLKWERLICEVKIPYVNCKGEEHFHYPDFRVDDEYLFEAKGEHLMENDEDTKLKVAAGKEKFGAKYVVFGLEAIEAFEDMGMSWLKEPNLPYREYFRS